MIGQLPLVRGYFASATIVVRLLGGELLSIRSELLGEGFLAFKLELFL